MNSRIKEMIASCMKSHRAAAPRPEKKNRKLILIILAISQFTVL
nr:MAG TPA: hypothetical protein [Caudoviricetes sp.]